MARTLVASENFNRANETLGSPNWSQLYTFNGQIQLAGNRVRGSHAVGVGGAPAVRWIGAGTFTDDQYALLEADAAFIGSNYHIGVVCRASADTGAGRDFYYASVVSDGGTPNIVLGKIVDGANTQLHAARVSWVDGDTIELEVEGTTLTVYHNGVSLGGSFVQTDSDISSGLPGIIGAGGSDSVAGDNWEAGSLSASTPDPDITDVDTDETLTAGQTGISVTGTDMGAANANRTFSIVQGAVDVDQTETGTGTATAATISLVMEVTGADLKFGAGDFTITRDDAAEDSIAVTLNPASGGLYVDLTSVNSTSADRITASPDLEIGDQLHARGEGGGAAPTGLTLNADGTFEFSSGSTPADFDVRVWDVNDATWGAWATQGVGAELVVVSTVHNHAVENIELSQFHVLGVQSSSHGHTAESLELSQAVDLSLDDSLHSHVADTVSLTQANSLAVNESAQAQSAENVTLNQQHLLAVLSAVHNQQSENITLQVAGALEVQSALHAHAADSVEFTQANQLAIDNASHEQAAEAIDLSTGLYLVVADALHQHGVDNVTLSQAHILTVSEALHAQASADIVLLQGSVMDADDALHSHATDAVVLTVGNLLAVASAVHMQQADAVAFTQAHTLVVSSALHAHLADHISLRIPGFVNKPGRVFVVEARNRTFVVARGNRTFQA